MAATRAIGICATFVLLLLAVGRTARCGEEEAAEPPRFRAYGALDFYQGTFKTDKDPSRYLYPQQEALEKALSADVPNRQEYAALLPLEIACALEDGAVLSQTYLDGVLKTMTRQKWKRALPLLSKGIARNIFYNEQAHLAAAVWWHLRIDGLTNEEQVALVLRTCAGDEPEVIPAMLPHLSLYLVQSKDVVRISLARKPDNSSVANYCRREIMKTLASRKQSLKTDADVERATLVGFVLGHCAISQAEAREIMKDGGAFNLFVAHVVLLNMPKRSQKSNESYIDASRQLWGCSDLDPAILRKVRAGILADTRVLPTLSQAESFYLELLKSIEQEAVKRPDDANSLRYSVLVCIRHTQDSHLLSAELLKRVQDLNNDPKFHKYTMEVDSEADVSKAADRLNTTGYMLMLTGQWLEAILKVHAEQLAAQRQGAK